MDVYVWLELRNWLGNMNAIRDLLFQAIIEEVLEENGYYNTMTNDQGATGTNK